MKERKKTLFLITNKLAQTFNTFFGDTAKNLRVQREECYHEIIFNNPGDPIFNSIEIH